MTLHRSFIKLLFFLTTAAILLFPFTFRTISSESNVPMPCSGGLSGIFPCNKMTLQAQVDLNRFASRPRSASNLWGYVDLDDQREYAIIGLSNGTAVVDVTKPTSPRVIGIVPAVNSIWREVKVYSFQNQKSGKWDAYAYITTEAIQGIQILDLSKLPVSVSLARVDREISTSHTAFIANVDFATGAALPGLTPYLYVEGADARFNQPVSQFPAEPKERTASCGARACGTGFPGASCTCSQAHFCSCMPIQPNPGFKAFSLTNPKNPKIIGSYNLTYMHDVYVETFTGEKAKQCAPGHDPCEIVFGWTGQDFRIIDFTDKKAPKVISTLTYENLGYPHSGWISKNKQWMFNFDEYDEISTGLNTRILSININDFKRPVVKARWEGSTSTIEHNGYVTGTKLYVSSYTRGLSILNVKNPTKPVEIAFFDTHPENDLAEFAGAWGVYPYLPSGNILISDINRGLFIVKEQP